MTGSAAWTFMSNHGHVLVAVAHDREARIRDIAEAVGITDRAVQAIMRDLVESGCVIRTREGRRNRYQVVRHTRFRHPLEAGVTVGAFLDLVDTGGTPARRVATSRGAAP